MTLPKRGRGRHPQKEPAISDGCQSGEITLPQYKSIRRSVVCLSRNYVFVPSIGTAVLIRSLRSPMQVSPNRGGRAFSKARF